MQTLVHLSDDELVSHLATCCFDIRLTTVRVLVLLAEVEQRRIHLAAAASSMWDYCRRMLQMSHGRAYRFIVVSRLSKRFPFLLEKIESGEAHVSTLAFIASFVTEHNVHALVAETKGKNRTAVGEVLRKWFGVEPSHGRAGNPMPYDAELLEMMDRARELLSHAIPSGDRLEISKVAFRILINHLEKMKRAKAEKPRPAPAKPTKDISRHATRTMFETHGDQCCFVDERTGARCPSRAFIQRDHVHMQAYGGGHESENLRPLCALCRVRHKAHYAEFGYMPRTPSASVDRPAIAGRRSGWAWAYAA